MIKLDNLKIRPAHPDDARDIFMISTDPKVIPGLLQVVSSEFLRTKEWLETWSEHKHRLVAEHAGKVIGILTLDQVTRPRCTHTGDFGIMIHSDYWGQGVGTALIEAMLDLADNWLNLKRLELEVHTNNAPAIGLYKKLGFEIEATKRAQVFGAGQYVDTHNMARLHPDLLHLPRTTTPAPTPERLPFNAEYLVIRPPRPQDYKSAYALFSNPLVGRTTLQIPSQEIPKIKKRYAQETAGIYRYMAIYEDKVIGAISIHQPIHRPRIAHTAGLGMSVHPSYWGYGVGSRLMATILDLADNWLNLKRIDLDVNTDNPAGIRLYEKFGFEKEGLRRFHAFGDGRWADSYIMARLNM